MLWRTFYLTLYVSTLKERNIEPKIEHRVITTTYIKAGRKQVIDNSSKLTKHGAEAFCAQRDVNLENIFWSKGVAKGSDNSCSTVTRVRSGEYTERLEYRHTGASVAGKKISSKRVELRYRWDDERFESRARKGRARAMCVEWQRTLHGKCRIASGKLNDRGSGRRRKLIVALVAKGRCRCS